VDPGIAIAIVSLTGLAISGFFQWRTAKNNSDKERQISRSQTSLDSAKLLDGRINAHLDRLDREVEALHEENKALKEELRRINDRLDMAIGYIRLNNLPWPPPLPTGEVQEDPASG
jgi:outer membrane murein-binding lipoprotein Lpp